MSEDKKLIELACKDAADCIQWMWDNMELPEDKKYLQSDAFNRPANALNILNMVLNPQNYEEA